MKFFIWHKACQRVVKGRIRWIIKSSLFSNPSNKTAPAEPYQASIATNHHRWRPTSVTLRVHYPTCISPIFSLLRSRKKCNSNRKWAVDQTNMSWRHLRIRKAWWRLRWEGVVRILIRYAIPNRLWSLNSSQFKETTKQWTKDKHKKLNSKKLIIGITVIINRETVIIIIIKSKIFNQTIRNHIVVLKE